MQQIKKYVKFTALTALLSVSLIAGSAYAKDAQANNLHDFNQYDPFGILEQLSEYTSQSVFPRVDIVETQNEIIIDADVPGIDLDNLKVTIENDMLTISGKELAQEKTDDARYYRQERFSGEFVRKIQLPSSIDQDEIKATNANGVLTITIPKKASAQAHTIEIEK